MPKIKSGISSIGGKFRLCNTILNYIPYHEFFLSMFCGACWVELNKPRSRYECWNDLSSEIINYLVMIERYPEEFDQMKQGVYGLVSQEICNRIVRGEIIPRNDLERSYFFYYLNKLTFGGDVKKVGTNDNVHAHVKGVMNDNYGYGNRQPEVDKSRKRYKEYETKGYCGLNQNRAIPQTTFHEKDIEKIKKDYGDHAHYCGLASSKGMGYDMNKKQIQKQKNRYEWKTKGWGLGNSGLMNGMRKRDIDKAKKEYETKGYHGLVDQKLQNARIDSKGVEEAKKNYKKVNLPLFSSGIGGGDGAGNDDNINKVKASFAGINNTRAGNNASNMRDMDKWKREFKDTVDEANKNSKFNGLQPDGMQVRKTNVDKAKSTYRGVILPTVCKDKSVNDAKSSYKGIAIHGATGWGTLEKNEVKDAKKQYQAVSYKGINPKTTRPYHNNDCGLLTPLDQKAIERLHYVNLTCYDFRKVYKLFYNAFHKRKGLNRECFVYADPPYPATEKYYGDKFKTEYHQELIDLMLETPFNFMLSIGGKCEMYLEQLSDWVIVPVKVRYSTDATSQKKSQEYIVMNYEINDIGNMKQDNQASIMRFMKK